MGNEKPEPWKFDIKEEGQKGLVGVYERMLRRYKSLVYALTLLPIYLLGALILAGALAPAVYVFELCSAQGDLLDGIWSWLWKGFGLGSGFFAYGFTLILLVPVINLFVRPFVRPARGQNYSTRFFAWYVHNALTYLVRYTFLEFITPTPFNLFFYRRMGMKIGKDVHINSSNVSDPLLITIEDRVTIGGSAVIIAHYAMGGYLIVSPVVIRKGATIGLHAKILGGVEIGEGAKILPGSVVMPKTVIPAGETWGGIPARRME
jgi:acetyltransferase-like isoleucine patch superfamily enzyme